jgi:hypothetical protein
MEEVLITGPTYRVLLLLLLLLLLLAKAVPLHATKALGREEV